MPPQARRFTRSVRAKTLNSRPTDRPAAPSKPSLHAGSHLSLPTAGMKRKEREFDYDMDDGDTSIKVAVRCRARTQREVEESSGVVVSTNGVKGETVELSMGPNALSNKTYHFDQVFSPAADQKMIFDEMVMPILDEVLRGFNCTIFAYGHTGTGKTYTMSGDISHQLPLSDHAGIIPRLLHALFAKLASPPSYTEEVQPESLVKVSFIELYNEELRDLLSPDDSVKLKIFDGDGKRGHAATLVQGAEESHIASASEGLRLLQMGSYKRQVAATKCNDLSSRSHTIFTVTVKQTTQNGEELVSTGKLNLVDLAGSESIHRSGAENVRAVETGLINKSLLTLRRVINALVDKSKHVPYRESKLTRLLQDSLGGETKTCIIATLSPARSNLEETISTLDYSFRAKNIQNKPQFNQLIPKKTLLREFTAEIEKLKRDLHATRQRNGIYLTQEEYDEITKLSESRRILTQEQRDQIELIEHNLGNKAEELVTSTTALNSLRKEHEACRLECDQTKELLEVSKAKLQHTTRSLHEESFVRSEYEKSEETLTRLGQDFLSALNQTTRDIDSLQSKLLHRTQIHSANRDMWHDTQHQVSDITKLAEELLLEFYTEQQALVEKVISRMNVFLQDELQKSGVAGTELQKHAVFFNNLRAKVLLQNSQSGAELDSVLEKMTPIQEDVKHKVGTGLRDLSVATQRISSGILTEIEAFHSQLHTSYDSLTQDIQQEYKDMLKELEGHRNEIDRLKVRISEANAQFAQESGTSIGLFQHMIEQEQNTRDRENEELVRLIQKSINANAQKQEMRMREMQNFPETLRKMNSERDHVHNECISGHEEWMKRSIRFGNKIAGSSHAIGLRTQKDLATVDQTTQSLKTVTASVYEETTKLVSNQIQGLDADLHGLNEVVDQIQKQRSSHYKLHEESLQGLVSSVEAFNANVKEALAFNVSRVESFNTDITASTTALQGTLPKLEADAEICDRLSQLRKLFVPDRLKDYTSTGHTPARRNYEFPTAIPRTESREQLLARMHGLASAYEERGPPVSGPRSPSKVVVFADSPDALDAGTLNLQARPDTVSENKSVGAHCLRERDRNKLNAPLLTSLKLAVAPGSKGAAPAVHADGNA